METEAAMLEPMAEKNKQGETKDLGSVHTVNPPENGKKLVENIEKNLNGLDIKSNISDSVPSRNIKNIEKNRTYEVAKATEESSILHEKARDDDSVTKRTVNTSDGEVFIEAPMEVQVPLENVLSDSCSGLQGGSTGKEEDMLEGGHLSKYIHNDEFGEEKDETHKLHMTVDKEPAELPREESLPKTDESDIMDEKDTIRDNNPPTDKEISSEDIEVPEFENENSEVEDEKAIEDKVADDDILQREMAKNKHDIQQFCEKRREPNLESAEYEESLHNSGAPCVAEKESLESLDHAVETIVSSPTTQIDFPMEEEKVVTNSAENITANQQKQLENLEDHVDDLKLEKSIYPELIEKNWEEVIDKKESEKVKQNITGCMKPDRLPVSKNLKETDLQNVDEQNESSENFSVLESKEYCPEEDGGEYKEKDPEKEQSTEGLRSDKGSQYHEEMSDSFEHGSSTEENFKDFSYGTVEEKLLEVSSKSGEQEKENWDGKLLPEEDYVKNDVPSDVVDQAVMAPEQLQPTSVTVTEEICTDEKNIEINNNMRTEMIEKNVEESDFVDNEVANIESTDTAETGNGPETFCESKNVAKKVIDVKDQVLAGNTDIIVSEHVKVQTQSVQDVPVNLMSLEGAPVVLQSQSNLQTNDATQYIEIILEKEDYVSNEAEVKLEAKFKEEQEIGEAVDERGSEVSAVPTHSPEISVDVVKEDQENTDSTVGVRDGVLGEEKVNNKNIDASFYRQLADEMQLINEQEKEVLETSKTVTDDGHCYRNAVDKSVLQEIEPSNQAPINVVGHSAVADTSGTENPKEISLVKMKEHPEDINNEVSVEPKRVHDEPKDNMLEDTLNVICKEVDLKETINTEIEKIDKEDSPTTTEGVPGSTDDLREHIQGEEKVDNMKIDASFNRQLVETMQSIIEEHEKKVLVQTSETMTDEGHYYRNAVDTSELAEVEPFNYQVSIDVVGHLVVADTSEIGNPEETSLVKNKEHVEEIKNGVPLEPRKVQDEPKDHMLQDPVNVVFKDVHLTEIINAEKEKIDKEGSLTSMEGVPDSTDGIGDGVPGEEKVDNRNVDASFNRQLADEMQLINEEQEKKVPVGTSETMTDEGYCYRNAVDKSELAEMEPCNYQGTINVVGHLVVAHTSEIENPEETSLLKSKQHAEEINSEVHVETRKVLDEPKDHMLEVPLNVVGKEVDLAEIINIEKQKIEKEASPTSVEGVQDSLDGVGDGVAGEEKVDDVNADVSFNIQLADEMQSLNEEQEEKAPVETSETMTDEGHCYRNAVEKSEIAEMEPSIYQGFINVVGHSVVADTSETEYPEETSLVKTKEQVEEINNEVPMEPGKVHDELKDHMLEDSVNIEKKEIDKEGTPTSIEGVLVMEEGQFYRNAIEKSELTELEPSNCQIFINVSGHSVVADTSETRNANETSLVKTKEHDEPKDYTLEDPLNVEGKEVDLTQIIDLEKEKIKQEESPSSLEVSHDSVPEVANELIHGYQNPPPNNLSEEVEFANEKDENSSKKIGENSPESMLDQNKMELCGALDQVKLKLEPENVENPPESVPEDFFCQKVISAEDRVLDSSGESFTSTCEKLDFTSEKDDNSCKKVSENTPGKELVEATIEVCGINDQVKLELEPESIGKALETVSGDFCHETGYAEAMELDNSGESLGKTSTATMTEQDSLERSQKENEVKKICTEKTENEAQDRDTDGFLDVVAETDNCERIEDDKNIIEDDRNIKRIITGVNQAEETMTKPNSDEESTKGEILEELNHPKQVMHISEENLNRVTSIEEISSGENQKNLLEDDNCKHSVENLPDDASEKLIVAKDGVPVKEEPEEKGSGEKQGEVIQGKGELSVMPEQTASDADSEIPILMLDADKKKICGEIDENKENKISNIMEEGSLEENLESNPNNHAYSVQTVSASLNNNHEEDLHSFEEQSHQTIISNDNILHPIEKERTEIKSDESEDREVGKDDDKFKVPEVPAKYNATKLAFSEDGECIQKNIGDIVDGIKEKHEEVLDTFSEEHQIVYIKEGTEVDAHTDNDDYQEDKIVTESVIEDPNHGTTGEKGFTKNHNLTDNVNEMIPEKGATNESAEAAKVDDEKPIQKNVDDIPDRNELVTKAIHDKVGKKNEEEPIYVCAEQIGQNTKTAETIAIAGHDKKIGTEKLEAVTEAVTVPEDNSQVTISKTDYKIHKDFEDNMLNIATESLSKSQALTKGSLECDVLDTRATELRQGTDNVAHAEEKIPASITSRSSLNTNSIQEEEESESDKRSTFGKNVTINACELELEEKRDKEVPKDEEISHNLLKSTPGMMSEQIGRFSELSEGQLIEEKIKYTDACLLTIDKDRNIVERRLSEKEGDKICSDAAIQTVPSNQDNKKNASITEEIKREEQNIEKGVDYESTKTQISETNDMKGNAHEVQIFEERSPKRESKIVLQQEDNKNSSIKDTVNINEMNDDKVTTIPLAEREALKSLHQDQRESATLRYQEPNYELGSSTEQNTKEITEMYPAKAKDEMSADKYNLATKNREFDIVYSKEETFITKIQDSLPIIPTLAEESREEEIKHEAHSDQDRQTQETIIKNNISNLDASKDDNNSEKTEQASAILDEGQSQDITTGTGVTKNRSMEGTLTTFEETTSEKTSSVASFSQSNEPSQKEESKSDNGTISDGVNMLSTMLRVQSQGVEDDEENEASTLVFEELEPEKNKEKETPMREVAADACIATASNLVSTQPASTREVQSEARESIYEDAPKHNNQEVKDSNLASDNIKSEVEMTHKSQLSHDERAGDDTFSIRESSLKNHLEINACIVAFEGQIQDNQKDSEIKEDTVSENESKEHQEIGENAEENKTKDTEQEEKNDVQLPLRVSEKIYNPEYNKESSEEKKTSETKIEKMGYVQSVKTPHISDALEDSDETDGIALHSKNKEVKEVDTTEVKELEEEKQEEVNERQRVTEAFATISKAKYTNVNLEEKESTRGGPGNEIMEDLENEKLLHMDIEDKSEGITQEYKDKIHNHGHEMLHGNVTTEEILEAVVLESTDEGTPRKLIDELSDTSKSVEETKYVEVSDSSAELQGTEIENLQEREKIESNLMEGQEKADVQLGKIAKTADDDLETVDTKEEIKNITEEDIVGTPDFSHARKEKHHGSSQTHENEAMIMELGSKLEPNESEDSVNEEPSKKVNHTDAMLSEEILMMDKDKEKGLNISSVAIAPGGEAMQNTRDEPEIVSDMLVGEVTAEEIRTTDMHYEFANNEETVDSEGSIEIEKFVHVSTDSAFVFDALNADVDGHQTNTDNLTNKDSQHIQQDELPVSRYLMDLILQEESGKLDGTLEVKQDKAQEETSKKSSDLDDTKQEGNSVSLSSEQITYDTTSERKVEDPTTSESSYDLVEELNHVSKKDIEMSLLDHEEVRENNIQDAPQLSIVDEGVNEEVSLELKSEEKSEPDRKVDTEDFKKTELSLENKVSTTNLQEIDIAREQDCQSLNNGTDTPTTSEVSKEDSFQQGRESAEILCHIPKNDKAPFVIPEQKLPSISVQDGNAEHLLHKEDILPNFDSQQTDKSCTSSNIEDEAPEVLRTLPENIIFDNEKDKQEKIIENKEVRKGVIESPSGVIKNGIPEEQKVSRQMIPLIDVPAENAESLLHKEEILLNFDSQQTGKSFTSSNIEDNTPEVPRTLPEGIIIQNEKEKQEKIIENIGEVQKSATESPSGAVMNDLPEEQKVPEQKIPPVAVPDEDAEILLHKEEILQNFDSQQTCKPFTSSDIEDKAPGVPRTQPEGIIVGNEKEKQEKIIENKGEVRKSVIENPSELVKNDLPEEQKVMDRQNVQKPDPVVESANEAVKTDEKLLELNKPNTIDEKETKKVENATIEEEKTDDEKGQKEEGGENKTEESGHSTEVMVEAREAELKPAHKKSHSILSGVGSKVKHSLAKVKKAITGKSSQPKTVSPK